jgi:hypothetical protein
VTLYIDRAALLAGRSGARPHFAWSEGQPLALTMSLVATPRRPRSSRRNFFLDAELRERQHFSQLHRPNLCAPINSWNGGSLRSVGQPGKEGLNLVCGDC